MQKGDLVLIKKHSEKWRELPPNHVILSHEFFFKSKTGVILSLDKNFYKVYADGGIFLVLKNKVKKAN